MRSRSGARGRSLRRPLLALLVSVSVAAVGAGDVHHQFHRTFRSSDSELHWIDGGRAPRGVITSRGFADPPWVRRDAPYSATWLLEAPRDHAVFAYMTQYHLADGDLRHSSFNICLNLSRGVTRCSWDRIVSEQTLRSGGYEAAKKANANPVRHTTKYAATTSGDSWLVLELDLPAGGGGGPADSCLQSTESSGFNITYEVVKLIPGNSVEEHARPEIDHCSVKECSFNGDCLASADFA